MTDDESRKAFEATISAPPFEKSVDRYLQESTAWPGNYIDYPVHLAYDMWQAAVELATKRERERCAHWCRTKVEEANAQLDCPGIPGLAVMKTVRAATASEILQHVRSGQEPKP